MAKGPPSWHTTTVWKLKQSFFHWLQQSATQWPKAPLPVTLQQSENKNSHSFIDYNSQPHNGQRPPFLTHYNSLKTKTVILSLTTTVSHIMTKGPPSWHTTTVWKQKQSFFHWLQQSATQWPKAPLPSHCKSGKQKQSFFHWLQQSATQWPKAPLPVTLQQSENKNSHSFIDYNSQPHNGQRPPFLSHYNSLKTKTVILSLTTTVSHIMAKVPPSLTLQVWKTKTVILSLTTVSAT